MIFKKTPDGLSTQNNHFIFSSIGTLSLKEKWYHTVSTYCMICMCVCVFVCVCVCARGCLQYRFVSQSAFHKPSCSPEIREPTSRSLARGSGVEVPRMHLPLYLWIALPGLLLSISIILCLCFTINAVCVSSLLLFGVQIDWKSKIWCRINKSNVLLLLVSSSSHVASYDFTGCEQKSAHDEKSAN